jgi:hypothetical protein
VSKRDPARAFVKLQKFPPFTRLTIFDLHSFGSMEGRNKRKEVDNDKVVFVGNVNFDATEEQLMSIFAQAGPVANLRLKYDRETGKPLGFGFVEVRIFFFFFFFFFFCSSFFFSSLMWRALLLLVAI